jgi:hypothetical protein
MSATLRGRGLSAPAADYLRSLERARRAAARAARSQARGQGGFPTQTWQGAAFTLSRPGDWRLLRARRRRRRGVARSRPG